MGQLGPYTPETYNLKSRRRKYGNLDNNVARKVHFGPDIVLKSPGDATPRNGATESRGILSDAPWSVVNTPETYIFTNQPQKRRKVAMAGFRRRLEFNNAADEGETPRTLPTLLSLTPRTADGTASLNINIDTHWSYANAAEAEEKFIRNHKPFPAQSYSFPAYAPVQEAPHQEPYPPRKDNKSDSRYRNDSVTSTSAREFRETTRCTTCLRYVTEGFCPGHQDSVRPYYAPRESAYDDVPGWGTRLFRAPPMAGRKTPYPSVRVSLAPQCYTLY